MDWKIWIVIGIICVIIEIMSPGFYFFSIGIGAIITGITGRMVTSIPIQIIVFAISTTISFLLMKKFSKLLLKKEDVPSNIYALQGKIGVVSKCIHPHQRGYVKIDGEEWSAVTVTQSETVEEGKVIKVISLEGNKVVVELHNEEET